MNIQIKDSACNNVTLSFIAFWFTSEPFFKLNTVYIDKARFDHESEHYRTIKPISNILNV